MQYAGRNPYGDIYRIPTSEVDDMTKRLYARQAAKEQQQRQDNKLLDDEFSRNMSNMRDADIPDLTKAYSDFKLAHIGLQKKGSKATPEDQVELLRRKAAVNEIISKSKLQKEQEKQFGASIMKDGNKYVRDAHGKLINIMKTPVNQLGDADPFAELPYKGNMTNLQKIFANAAGKEIKMDDEIVDNEKELRKDVTHVSRMANAVEYYKNVLGQVVGSQGEDDLVRSVATNISPELYNATKLQYEQMMADPVMRKRLGMTSSDLPEDEGLTETERAAKFLAMTHQLAAKPILKAGTPIYSKVDLSDKKRKEGLEDWLWKNGIVYQQSLNKIAANKQAGMPLDSGVGYPTQEIAEKYGKDMDVTMPGGAKTTQRVIFIDEADPNEIDFIRGFVKGKSLGVQPIAFKGGRKGFIYHPGTKDWEGANGQMVNGERVRRDVINNIVNTKFKVEQNTKKKATNKGEFDDLK